MLQSVIAQTGENPKLVVIWMHGLGADGNDFAPVVPQFIIPGFDIKFIFPHAPKIPVTINGGMVMRAWYDIKMMDIGKQPDKQGILASEKLIYELIDQQINDGFKPEQIVLAGFSQGGAMSLQIGTYYPQKLAGIIALSCYLPIPESLDKKNSANINTPIFMAHGSFDPVVPFVLGQSSRNALKKSGYSIDWHEYPIQHGASMDEIMDIKTWIEKKDCSKLMSDVYDLPRLEKLLKAQNINKKINFYTSTESTNLLASQTSSDEIFLADHQSNGRGRRGKTWITPSGQSIALSVSHRFQAPLAELAGLNIAVAVAVIKTFNHFGIEGFFLKWPNDIYGDNGKVGGILIEASGNQVNSRAIVGIGLNWCVDQALQQDISQKHMNIPTKNLDKTNFVAQLIIQLEKTFKEFNNNQLNLLMSIWNQYDKYRNQQVQIIQGDSHTLAKYLNITSKGELLVKIGNETKTISAGEVSMRKVD